MTTRKALLVRTIAAALSAAALVSTADASACGGGWYVESIPEIDHRPRGLTIAEAHTDKGEYKQAAAIIVRMMPHVKQLEVKSSEIVERAQHVLAVATARTNGQLEFGDEVPAFVQDTWLGETEEDRVANLDWSIAALRALDTAREGDATIRTDLAEALAKVDAHRAEAKDILEQLAKEGKIASPQGHATLAGLRGSAGDAAGKHAALEACSKMSADSAVCEAAKS